MNNRLQQFLDLENLSPARLADMLGVQRSGVSHILSGRNKPGFDFIQKLLTKFPALSADWFLTGKGKPYKEMNNFVNSGGENTAVSSSGNGVIFQEKNPSAQWKNGSNFHDEKSSGQWKNREFSRGTNFAGQTSPQVGSPYFQNGNLNKDEKFSHPEDKILEHYNYHQKDNQNSEDLYPNNNSNSTNDFNTNKINTDNMTETISDINSDLLYNNLNSDKTKNINYNTGMEEEEASSSFEGDFFNEMEPAGRTNVKSNFLESNDNNRENSRYLPDNKTNTAQNGVPYRHENQINVTNKGNDGKKRSVKRIIVFYNDGSFEELYPSGVGK